MELPPAPTFLAEVMTSYLEIPKILDTVRGADLALQELNIIIIIIIMYLYSAQYLHILQDSKRYLTNPTVQVQPQLTRN